MDHLRWWLVESRKEEAAIAIGNDTREDTYTETETEVETDPPDPSNWGKMV